MLGMNYGPDEDPLAILKRRGPRARSRSMRKGDDYHELIKARLKDDRALAGRQRRRRREGVRRYRGGDGKAARRQRRSRLAGQAHQFGVARISARGCFSARSSPRSICRPMRAETDSCGTCRACLDICPTAAFPAPYRLDARRCISYLTIEHKGPIPREFRAAMGNRIYGCDDCLAVCPWNKFAQAGPRGQARRARHACARRSLAELARLDDAQFRALFAKTSIKRTGRDRFVRNVLIAIGNSGDAVARARKPSACSTMPRRWCAAPRCGRCRDYCRAKTCAALRKSDSDASVQRRVGRRAGLKFLHRRDQPLDVLRPRQPVVAVLDQRQHHVVAGKARHQFDARAATARRGPARLAGCAPGSRSRSGRRAADACGPPRSAPG